MPPKVIAYAVFVFLMNTFTLGQNNNNVIMFVRRSGPSARDVQCPDEIMTYECTTSESSVLTWFLPDGDSMVPITFARGTSTVNVVQSTSDGFFDVYFRDDGNLSSILLSYFNPSFNGRNISCTARNVISSIPLKFAGTPRSPMPKIIQTSTGYTEASVHIEWNVSSDSYIDCYNVSVMGENPVCVTSNELSTTVSYAYLETSEVFVSLCAINVCGEGAQEVTARSRLVPHEGALGSITVIILLLVLTTVLIVVIMVLGWFLCRPKAPGTSDANLQQK